MPLFSPLSFVQAIEEDLVDEDDKKKKRVDPSEGASQLPVYLKGGQHVVGFGALLGHALSLLLTARHGLKESELWSMLAVIQDEEKKMSMSSVSINDDARALIAVCYGYRGSLEDHWRTEDPMQRGYILRKSALKGMKKVNSEFTNDDLTLLLVIIDRCPHRLIDYTLCL